MKYSNGFDFKPEQESVKYLDNVYNMQTSQDINLADKKYDYVVGVSDLSATLQSIKTSVGTTKVNIKLPIGANVATTVFNNAGADMSNIRLEIPDGATISSTQNFNLGGMYIEANTNQPVFVGDLTKIIGTIGNSTLYPEWFGAIGDFNGTIGTDNSTALNKVFSFQKSVEGNKNDKYY